MLFCSKCGNTMPDNTQFCARCGNAMILITKPGASDQAADQAPQTPPVQQAYQAPQTPFVQPGAQFAGNMPNGGAAGSDVRPEFPGNAYAPGISSGSVQYERPSAEGAPVPSANAGAEFHGTGGMAAPTAPAQAAPSSFGPANGGLPMPGGLFAPGNAPGSPVEPIIPQQPMEYVIPNEPAPMMQNGVAPMPAQPVYQAPPPVMRPKKKKGKAGVIIGISAAAVVGGGAAAGYFLFHDDITRMFMGESGYAQMISHSAFEEVEKETGTAGKFIAKALDSSNGMNPGKTLSLPSSVGMTIADYIAAPLSSAAGMSGAAPEGTSLTSSANISFTAGSLLGSTLPMGSQDVIDLINSLTFSTKQINGETDLVSFGISDNNGNNGSLEIYRNANGDIIVAFPGISDKTVEVGKEKIEGTAGVQTKTAAGVRFDENEAKRLLDEIIKIYYESYGSAKITYTDGVTASGSLKGSDAEVNITVTGTEAKIVFTGEQMVDILKKSRDLIIGDEYVKRYAKEAYGMDEDKLAETFSIDMIDASKIPTVTVSHIVDVHNNVLSSSVSIKDTGSSTETTFSWMKKGSDKYISADMTNNSGDHYMLRYAVNKKSDSEGNAVFSFSQSGKSQYDIVFDCAFSGYSMEEWLGSKVPVGKLTIKLSDPEAFAAQFKELIKPNSKTMSAVGPALSGIDTEKMIDELKKLSIVSEASLSGNKYSGTFSISAGDIGSLTVKSVSETGTETASAPGTDNNIDLSDSKALSDLIRDAAKWLRNIITPYNTINVMVGPLLDNMINAVTGTETDPVDPDNPDGTDPVVITDDPGSDLTPDEMDNIAKKLSGGAEMMLGLSGSISGYTESRADQLLIVFKCDADGKWTPSKAYAEGYETVDAIVSDELWNGISERLNKISEDDSKIRELLAGFYFSSKKYAGTLVMKASDRADFDLFGMPNADNMRIGTFVSWYDNSADGNGTPGYFADYDGNKIYLGTYCVSTGKPLTNPENTEPRDYAGIDGDWEIVKEFGSNDGKQTIVVIKGTVMTIDDRTYTLSYRTDTGDLITADIYEAGRMTGTIEFGNDGESAVLKESDGGEEIRIRKINYALIASLNIGEITYDPDLNEIAGVWETQPPNDRRSFAISSDNLMSPFEINQAEYYYLEPGSDYISLFSDSDHKTKAGYMLYSRSGGKILIRFKDSDAPVVLKKTEEATKPPYYGSWKVKDIGEFSGDPDTIMNITDFYAVFSGDSFIEIYLIFNKSGDDNDKVFRVYSESNDPTKGGEWFFEYDPDTRIITMTGKNKTGEEFAVTFERS